MKEGIYLVEDRLYLAKNIGTGSRVYLVRGVSTKDLTFETFHDSDKNLKEIEITKVFKGNRNVKKLASLEAVFDLFV